jgi:hypothetical protein
LVPELGQAQVLEPKREPAQEQRQRVPVRAVLRQPVPVRERARARVQGQEPPRQERVQWQQRHRRQPQ